MNKKIIKCVLCQNNSFNVVSKIDEKCSEELFIYLCDNCGLIQQIPLPTIKELQAYYSQNYGIDYKNACTPKPKHIYREGMTAIQRIKFLVQLGAYIKDNF